MQLFITSVLWRIWCGEALRILLHKCQWKKCNSSCLEDCNCGAALFRSNYCQKQKFPLRSLSRDRLPLPSYTAFLKMGLIPKKPLPPDISNTILVTSKVAIVKIVLVTSGFTILSCVVLATFGHFIHKIRVLSFNLQNPVKEWKFGPACGGNLKIVHVN